MREKRLKFRPKELAIVLSHYDIGEIREIHAFRRGHIYTPKSVIISEKGKFLLKRRPEFAYKCQHVRLVHEIVNFLANNNFCVARLIPTRHDGQTLLEIENFLYELYEFVDGTSYNQSIEATKSAGYCLKKLHNLTASYTPSIPVPAKSYHDSPAVRKNMQRILPSFSSHESVAGNIVALESLITTIYTRYNDAAQKAKQAGFEQYPPIPCHGDWHPGNMIFRDNKVVAVIDFDSVCSTPALCDIATGCLLFSMQTAGNIDNWPDELNAERAAHFLSACQDNKPWSQNQLELIIALMTEALISEAVGPIAATGMFAHIQGYRFLQMIKRKTDWLLNYGFDTLKAQLS